REKRSFQVAAGSVGGGEEVQDHRAPCERVFQTELEALARQPCRRGEGRRLVAWLQGGMRLLRAGREHAESHAEQGVLEGFHRASPSRLLRRIPLILTHSARPGPGAARSIKGDQPPKLRL